MCSLVQYDSWTGVNSVIPPNIVSVADPEEDMSLIPYINCTLSAIEVSFL